MNRVRDMRTIEMPTEDLIKALEKNLEVHNEVYSEAIENFWKQVQDEFDEEIEEAQEVISNKDLGTKRGVFVQIAIKAPINREEDYKTAIAMFKAEVKKTVEVSQREFEMYVLNKWDWADEFLTSNSMYASAGTISKFSG